MKIWLKSLAAGAVVAALVFFLSDLVMNSRTPAKYTVQYTVKAEPDPYSRNPLSLSKIIRVLERRLEAAAYVHEIKIREDNLLQVVLSGIKDTLYPPYILTANGRVQFREVYTMSELAPLLTAAMEVMAAMNPPPVKKTPAPVKRDSMSKKVSDLLDSIELTETKQAADPGSSLLIEFFSPYTDAAGKTQYPASIGNVKRKDTASVRKLFETDRIKKMEPANWLLCYGEPTIDKKKNKEDWLIPIYFLKTTGNPDKALLENEDISDASQDFDEEGKVTIHMQFNHIGTRKWATMTRNNIGRSIAITIDGIVLSAPTVTDVILDGSSTISGSYTAQEAASISIGLRSVRLPATLSIISSRISREKSPGRTRQKLLASLVIFVVSTGIGFFIFKTLKST